MLARIKAARENESGFTLIELLIVIVILGVLAGVVVFSVSGISGRGNAEACNANRKTVQVASEAHYALKSAYAADMAALVTAGLLQAAPAPLTGAGADAAKGVSYSLVSGAKPVITGGSSCT